MHPKNNGSGVGDYAYDYVLGKSPVGLAILPSLSQISCLLEESERAMGIFNHSQGAMLQSHEGIV